MADATALASRRPNLAPARLGERFGEQISENGIQNLPMALRETPCRLRERLIV